MVATFHHCNHFPHSSYAQDPALNLIYAVASASYLEKIFIANGLYLASILKQSRAVPWFWECRSQGLDRQRPAAIFFLQPRRDANTLISEIATCNESPVSSALAPIYLVSGMPVPSCFVSGQSCMSTLFTRHPQPKSTSPRSAAPDPLLCRSQTCRTATKIFSIYCNVPIRQASVVMIIEI